MHSLHGGGDGERGLNPMQERHSGAVNDSVRFRLGWASFPLTRSSSLRFWQCLMLTPWLKPTGTVLLLDVVGLESCIRELRVPFTLLLSPWTVSQLLTFYYSLVCVGKYTAVWECLAAKGFCR